MADVTQSTQVPAAATAEEKPKNIKPTRKKPSGRARNNKDDHSNKAQKLLDREFLQHKARILANLGSSACDLSPKGSVDAKCHAIMDTLNTHSDYVTTSSCSGRIALFHSMSASELPVAATATSGGAETREDARQKMKRGAHEALGWLAVKHGMLRPCEARSIVLFLCGEPQSVQDTALDTDQLALLEDAYRGHEEDEEYSGEAGGVVFTGSSPTTTAVPTVGTVCIKMEPFVMHVQCRTMESAKELLSASVSDSGYRNSGVVPPGRKIMCGIRNAAGLGLEVPVVIGGINFVKQQREYVWNLLALANAKMHANEERTKLLGRSIVPRLEKMAAAAADASEHASKSTERRGGKVGENAEGTA